MAPFPWRKSASQRERERKLGAGANSGQDQETPARSPGPKYFYKSLLLICCSLLSRQMHPAADPTIEPSRVPLPTPSPPLLLDPDSRTRSRGCFKYPRETRRRRTRNGSRAGERRVCDDNGGRRGEAQWFQLASPRGATTTSSSMSIGIASIGTSATGFVGVHRAPRKKNREKERESERVRMSEYRGHRQGRDQEATETKGMAGWRGERDAQRRTVVGRHRERSSRRGPRTRGNNNNFS